MSRILGAVQSIKTGAKSIIYEVSRDILLSDAHAIAYSVAPNDNFATGLVLSLREHWPALYKDFRNYCHIYHPKAGEQSTWVKAEGQRIVNLMTQEAAYDTRQGVYRICKP